MYKKLLVLIVTIGVPFVIFNFVVLLNETSFEKEDKKDKKTNFNVEKKKQIQKAKPKPKPKPKPKRTNQPLPSMKPSNVGNSLGGDGLSFGMPQFSEAEFGEFKDEGLLGDMKNKTMDKDSVDSAPKVMKRSPIVYPELARKQGVSGFVLLNVLIDERGRVEDIEIIESKPKEIFDISATNTVRKWKFEPATYMGKKVKVWATQKIVFKLN
ncbi:MAG: energy transducer TonB [Campylobacterota bacterium]|nr:energy transducer TonB [Campylobacterota bacterium]